MWQTSRPERYQDNLGPSQYITFHWALGNIWNCKTTDWGRSQKDAKDANFWQRGGSLDQRLLIEPTEATFIYIPVQIHSFTFKPTEATFMWKLFLYALTTAHISPPLGVRLQKQMQNATILNFWGFLENCPNFTEEIKVLTAWIYWGNCSCCAVRLKLNILRLWDIYWDIVWDILRLWD